MMLVTDDRDPMTFEETCLLLEGVRNPRIMRDDVEKYLSELVSELVHGVKARDISVVKYIIPLIPELRQMLLDTVNDFFDLPLSEHDRRRKLLAEEAEWNRKHHPDYFEMSPEWQAAYAARYAPVEAAIARLSLDGWKRNAVFFINNPLEMVRNVVAAECLRRVLEMTEIAEDHTWEGQEHHRAMWSVVRNAPGCTYVIDALRTPQRFMH
jgi:hypothetical protein